MLVNGLMLYFQEKRAEREARCCFEGSQSQTRTGEKATDGRKNETTERS